MDYKIGDNVRVPRTGGGYSDGEILEIYLDRAMVTFPVGATFRGDPVDPAEKDKMAYKNVALADLRPVFDIEKYYRELDDLHTRTMEQMRAKLAVAV